MEDQFSRPNSKTGVFWIHNEDEPHKGCVAVNLVTNGTIDPLTLRIFVYLDDRARSEPSFKPIWNEFLRAMNLFQFLHPRTGFFCESGIEDIEHYEGLNTGPPPPVLSSDWLAVLEESTEDPYHRLLGKLADLDAPAPKLGFEITNRGDEILTTAEIAWPDQKVALLYDECWEDRADCKKEGWECLHLNRLSEEGAQKILERLN